MLFGRSNLLLAAVLAMCLGVVPGCTSLTMTEQAEWGHLLQEDVVDEPIKHKNVWAAGILDFLIPGVGHFYLGEMGSGGGLFLSNILWPLSPFWAVPAAVADTRVVNERYTVNYYTFGPGKAEIEKRDKAKVLNRAKEYVRLQMQRGRSSIERSEITEFLFLQDFSSEYILSLNWHELELRTGAKIIASGAEAPVRRLSPEGKGDGLPAVSAPSP